MPSVKLSSSHCCRVVEEPFAVSNSSAQRMRGLRSSSRTGPSPRQTSVVGSSSLLYAELSRMQALMRQSVKMTRPVESQGGGLAVNNGKRHRPHLDFNILFVVQFIEIVSLAIWLKKSQ